jgi:hypothetical protein
MPDKDEFDVLLDSALATYADPGADAGLEQRVLTALAGERKAGGEHRWSWPRRLAWAIAAPVAASVLLWVGVENGRHRPRVENQPARPAETARGATPHTAAADTARVEMRATHPAGAKAPRRLAAVAARLTSCPVTEPNANVSRGAVSIVCPGATETSPRMQAAEARPKLDVFPTPQPLTPEEQVLVAAATDSSPVVQAALQTPQITGDAPLSIASLDIPPLAVSGDGHQ